MGGEGEGRKLKGGKVKTEPGRGAVGRKTEEEERKKKSGDSDKK